MSLSDDCAEISFHEGVNFDEAFHYYESGSQLSDVIYTCNPSNITPQKPLPNYIVSCPTLNEVDTESDLVLPKLKVIPLGPDMVPATPSLCSSQVSSSTRDGSPFSAEEPSKEPSPPVSPSSEDTLHLSQPMDHSSERCTPIPTPRYMNAGSGGPSRPWYDLLAAMRNSIHRQALFLQVKETQRHIHAMLLRLYHPMLDSVIERIPLPNTDEADPIEFCRQLTMMMSQNDCEGDAICTFDLADIKHKPIYVMYGHRALVMDEESRMIYGPHDPALVDPPLAFFKVAFDSNPSTEPVGPGPYVGVPLAGPLMSEFELNQSSIAHMSRTAPRGDCFFTLTIESDNRTVRLYVTTAVADGVRHSVCLVTFHLESRIYMQLLYVLYRAVLEWGCLDRLVLMAQQLNILPLGLGMLYERLMVWPSIGEEHRVQRVQLFPRPAWMGPTMASDVARTHCPCDLA